MGFRRISAAVFLLAVLVLSACGSEPAPTTPSSSTAAASSPAAPADVTSQVKDALPSDLAELVTSAAQNELGRVQVDTSLTDPRGADGSSEAEQAIAICEATVSAFDASSVSVMEADGTSWILYGHPSYGDTCTEV